MIPPVKPIALNSSTYTEITSNEAFPTPFSWFTEDSSSYYLASDSAGVNKILVPEGAIINQTLKPFPSGGIFYAKAVSGTPNLALITGLR